MTHPVRACPVCGSSQSTRRYHVADPHYGIPGLWWIRECAACASYFLEELPSQEALAGLYAPDYYAYASPPARGGRRALLRLLGFSRDTQDPAFATPGRVLDFGCGSGDFLLQMRAKGWECAGVEINPFARERANALGLDVRPALRGPEGFSGGAFDYVRANHSLEHVRDPAQVLREMFELLKPGGTLFIGVPTTTSENARVFGAAWWHLTPPLHTFVPSTRGLRALLVAQGFRVLRESTNGDFAGTAGSLQIALNRGTQRRSNQGIVFMLRPLLLPAHWYARLQDIRGVGDKLEVVATRPA